MRDNGYLSGSRASPENSPAKQDFLQFHFEWDGG